MTATLALALALLAGVVDIGTTVNFTQENAGLTVYVLYRNQPDQSEWAVLARRHGCPVMRQWSAVVEQATYATVILQEQRRHVPAIDFYNTVLSFADCPGGQP